MTHNVYAVLNPTKTDYAANYKVYIGDASTGDPLSAYGSATVTWSWRMRSSSPSRQVLEHSQSPCSYDDAGKPDTMLLNLSRSTFARLTLPLR